ncbi:hypothetical protein MKX03_028032 [Papaver bracteatum]|nr:hypothetical protein MKX03_028032 [Papaver bracteatum]
MDRYDVALGTNTLGPKNILDLSKKCVKLEMLLHVSTAYVCGEKAGLILEEPYKMGETLNRTKTVLDIEMEKKVIEQKLEELRAKQLSKTEETKAMKELGFERARMFGWPNVYVFAKAMGEMLIGERRKNLPIVIVRPTIVTSTIKEPFPGWVEVLKTQPTNPLMGKDGKPIKVVKPYCFKSMNSLQIYMDLKYNFPLKVVAHTHHIFTTYAILRHDDGGFCNDMERQVQFVTKLAKLNEPYLVFKGSFDDSNTEKLRISVKSNVKEEKIFYFDPESINWDNYFMNIHLPSLMAYVLNN